jgi:hypothetical protein
MQRKINDHNNYDDFAGSGPGVLPHMARDSRRGRRPAQLLKKLKS